MTSLRAALSYKAAGIRRLIVAFAAPGIVLISATALAQTTTGMTRKGQAAARILEGPDQDAIYVELTAGDPRFVDPPASFLHSKEGEVLVRMTGFQIEDSPGDPAVPYRRLWLAVPPEADLESLQVEIVHEELGEFGRPVRVAPAPPPLFGQPARPGERPGEAELRWEHQQWGMGKAIIAGRNVRIYEKDALYRNTHVEVAAAGQLRKWRAATVSFYPIRFNPVTGDAVMARRLVVKVTFERDPAVRPPSLGALRPTAMKTIARPW